MSVDLTRAERSLLDEIARRCGDSAYPESVQTMVHKDDRRHWRLERDERAWSPLTYSSLADKGLIKIAYKFAGRTDVSITSDGLTRLDL